MALGNALDALAPEPRRLEDVGLVDARDLLAREAEGDLGDPLDLLGRVHAGVVGAAVAAAAVAEVDAAGQLAHDEQVGALDAVAAQRTRLEQGRAGTDGA